VFDRGKGHCLAGALNDDLGGRAQGRVEGKLAHELTSGRELDQLARLIRINVDRVVVGREQIAVGCQREADRPVEVRRILIDEGTRAGIRMRLARVLDGENLVVARGGNLGVRPSNAPGWRPQVFPPPEFLG
jgi:hypothetical protein